MRRRLGGIIVFGGCVIVVLLLVALAGAHRGESPAAKEVDPIDLEGLRAKAERGDAQAQKAFGSAYSKGQSVAQSYAEAARWDRVAAEAGNAAAQTVLGELYQAGQGVPQDDAEAPKWYRRAADQGH